ncbi:DeoR/GlpR family DNA-binding transcription regulator [Streptomyces sp. NBC_01808]|uniref:DeoR/GlpR family DNA-binding transcription regulator n=1 Tax=Streptomyces sp. NBC_01808 TaxID=2975947 RepID=UPI002DD95A2F|nr:DeoR/GlpR family DNA-binding transcription regulator [Streptomyces sp. NBC_01808]WSA37258.1 DeoR/GlpR family DNA-binding transcription regulator [Streptomyces sp. NBC_01808]
MQSTPAIGSRERRERIEHLATTTGLASVDELSKLFRVTPSTIRRDLARLTAEGRLARTYGGVMPLTAHPEASLRQRIGEAYEAKQAIARAAAALVEPGEHLLLDAGSTVGALAHELRTAQDLTVATTGLTALNELTDAEGVRLRCLGGDLRPLSQGFVGPLAEAALERLTFDRVFLGTDGIAPGIGVCEADLAQTRLKELMARRADHVYVLAHAAKLGRRPFHAWAQLPAGWTLITDAEAEERDDVGSTVDRLRAEGAEVLVAPGIRREGEDGAWHGHPEGQQSRERADAGGEAGARRRDAGAAG